MIGDKIQEQHVCLGDDCSNNIWKITYFNNNLDVMNMSTKTLIM